MNFDFGEFSKKSQIESSCSFLIVLDEVEKKTKVMNQNPTIITNFMEVNQTLILKPLFPQKPDSLVNGPETHF